LAEPPVAAGTNPDAEGATPRAHIDQYGEAYYASYLAAPVPYRWGELFWEEFFGHLSSEIVTRLRPRSVLDAGCAIGFLVKSLRDCGVEAEGIDSSAWAIAQVPPDVGTSCRVGSVTDELSRDYDLITCIEVLEHVSPQEATSAVANFCRHSRSVLFSSTPDRFDEVTHVNVRPVEYWTYLFAINGFCRTFDFDATFVAPHAILFQPAPQWPQVVRAYERWGQGIEHELSEVRAHRDRLSGELGGLLDTKRELIALKNTKTFRLSASLRSIWARTGGRHRSGVPEESETSLGAGGSTDVR
jgi:SAM-dependent methyltransferase